MPLEAERYPSVYDVVGLVGVDDVASDDKMEKFWLERPDLPDEAGRRRDDPVRNQRRARLRSRSRCARDALPRRDGGDKPHCKRNRD